MELINLLKSGKAYDSRGLLVALRIDPGDVEATQLVANQLEALQRYGLVKESSHGWRWMK
ncbi:MAG TPA: hypothetical protein PLI05_11400 [Methanotrichaceae archaeon]|nr:hypothetical protein [Methanotrichaceae archaeon]HQI92241.1 hypothetical protein [Methanotrichaceae archaeon]